jgi:hypothetical protein
MTVCSTLGTSRRRGEHLAAWMTGSGRTRAHANVGEPAQLQVSSRAIGSGRAAVDELGHPRHTLPRRLLHEVSHGLPSCPQLRLALGHVVPERHVPRSRVIHHPLQQSRGHELLGDARKRRAQPMDIAPSFPASSLIQRSVFLASMIGNRGSFAFGQRSCASRSQEPAWRAAARNRSGSSCPAAAPCPLDGRRPLP